MALPTIQVDSNGGGSDTNNSGAGPGDGVTTGSAVTSTTISTDAAGTTVTIPNADLTNVATDGSHVMYINDTTAGHLRFSKITGKANSGAAGANVTVATAYTINLANQTGGIGGKRVSIGGSGSLVLFDNNGAAGDALPGWTIQMASAHSETLSAAFNMRGAGDSTNGMITLQGVAGAATLPLLTFSINSAAIAMRGGYTTLKGFEIQNSNATKTASTAITLVGSGATNGPLVMDSLKISNSTNKFWRGIDGNSNAPTFTLRSSNIGFCADAGFTLNGTAQNVGGAKIYNNFIHDCGNNGLDLEKMAYFGLLVAWNVIYNNTGQGIFYDNNRNDNLGEAYFINNTVDNNTSDGLRVNGTTGKDLTFMNLVVVNNIFSNNGGFGVNMPTGSITTAYLNGIGAFIQNNNTFNNTSGAYSPSSAGGGDPGLNPNYAAASSGNFNIGTNLKAQGFPLGGTLQVGSTSNTNSYEDIGAAQRQEPAASGGGGQNLVVAGMGHQYIDF